MSVLEMPTSDLSPAGAGWCRTSVSTREYGLKPQVICTWSVSTTWCHVSVSEKCPLAVHDVVSRERLRDVSPQFVQTKNVVWPLLLDSGWRSATSFRQESACQIYAQVSRSESLSPERPGQDAASRKWPSHASSLAVKRWARTPPPESDFLHDGAQKSLFPADLRPLALIIRHRPVPSTRCAGDSASLRGWQAQTAYLPPQAVHLRPLALRG